MTTTFAAPKTEVPRDRFGRPQVVPPNGGKPTYYTRATTLADTLDDRYNLELWKMRQVALGLTERNDLLLSVSAIKSGLQSDDYKTVKAAKTKLNGICSDALEAAKSSAAATTGTAIHALTEQVDRDEPLPPLPAETMRDLEAYQQATSIFSVHAIETFVVVDSLQVAGTFDRLVEYRGQKYIADLKTGSTMDFGMGSIAIQLALYSRGMAYDHATHQRTPLDVDQEAAIVIHLPAGTGTCTLLWVDIRLGWEAAQLAHRVRKYRTFSKKGLHVPLT